MIRPTIGRVVWYYPRNSRPDDQPHTALVSYVHSDTLVNLAAFDQNGSPYQRGACTSVRLLQDDENPPADGSAYCTWMPYQKEQAVRHTLSDQAIKDEEKSRQADAVAESARRGFYGEKAHTEPLAKHDPSLAKHDPSLTESGVSLPQNPTHQDLGS